MDSDHLLNEGLTAYRAGRKAEAREFFSQAVKLDQSNEKAWLWLSSVVDTDLERRVCLEQVLDVNPANEAARRGLRRLQAAAPEPAASPEPEPAGPATPRPFPAIPSSAPEPLPAPPEPVPAGIAAPPQAVGPKAGPKRMNLVGWLVLGIGILCLLALVAAVLILLRP